VGRETRVVGPLSAWERAPILGKTALLELRILKVQNTVPVNFAGNPALAMPVPLKGRPVVVTSLHLIGSNIGEAELLNAGRMIGRNAR